MSNQYPEGDLERGELPDNFAQSYYHEVKHACDFTSNCGMFSILEEDNQTLLWWGEGEAEHETQVAFFGDPHLTLPTDRPHDDFIYGPIRTLRHGVLSWGSNQIEQDLVVDASLESLTATMQPARLALDLQLRHSFAPIFPELEGANIVRVISEEYNRAPTAHRPMVIHSWLARIADRASIAWPRAEETPVFPANIASSLMSVSTLEEPA
jgi:hypothetical protein